MEETRIDPDLIFALVLISGPVNNLTGRIFELAVTHMEQMPEKNLDEALISLAENEDDVDKIIDDVMSEDPNLRRRFMKLAWQTSLRQYNQVINKAENLTVNEPGMP